MSSHKKFDLSLSLQHPELIYSGDCIHLTATLKSDHVVNFEMNLPVQASYEVLACERSPLRMQASSYYQSIEWTLQAKSPGSIHLPALQAKLTGLDSQQTLSTEALSIEIQAYPKTKYNSEALKLPTMESNFSTLSPTWLLLSLLLIGLIAAAVRMRKRSLTVPTQEITAGPQTTQCDDVFTSDIAVDMLSKTSSSTPPELSVHLEALAYKRMSHAQRVRLTQQTKAYLES